VPDVMLSCYIAMIICISCHIAMIVCICCVRPHSQCLYSLVQSYIFKIITIFCKFAAIEI
jgi:hypothetical protein